MIIEEPSINRERMSVLNKERERERNCQRRERERESVCGVMNYDSSSFSPNL